LARHSERQRSSSFGLTWYLRAISPACRPPIEGAHGRDFQVTTVNSSGQIHFLTPFNVFVPLTRCLTFGVHSNFAAKGQSFAFVTAEGPVEREFVIRQKGKIEMVVGRP
jgi:hypothetical protein